MEAHEPFDGRHARRQRSREAVIDAVFALVSEGKVPPSADDVAERAGVSVSSIFRNFDGLHDLQRQALERCQADLRTSSSWTMPASSAVSEFART